MRLLHVIGSMDPVTGGPCQGIRNSNPEMERLGVYREVVCLDSPDASFLGMDDFPVHVLGPAIGPWRYSRKLLLWLIENMGRFDVVIINGLWIYSSYACHRAMQIIKKRQGGQSGDAVIPKLYVMPHGMLDPYFQRAPDRRLKALRNWFYWHLIECKVLNDAYGVLFTCETEMRLARQTFKSYKPLREINVGYGIIPPPEFTPVMQTKFSEKCSGLDGQPYLLFLSRIHEKKGVDILIRAYATVFERALKVGKTIPKLVIAGPGLRTVFGKKLQNLVSRYPQLGDSVLFPGMIAGDGKWGALYGCETFILPSHQENFGIAVVEALACGKPVLISNQVNIWMEISQAGAGLVASDTIEGTVALLEKWVELPASERSAMSKNAIDVFTNHFHIKTAAISFYNAISA